jgi:hypothetical protein
VNDDPASDGLARVQTESHIPATTWRQWCQRLDVDPAVAVELWDEVCHPIMLCGQAPDVALILQLRAARPDIYIDDFREELPAVLLSTSLADGLYTDTEGQGAIRGALLRLYRHLGQSTGDPIGRAFVAHTGSLALLDGILPDDLTLPKLVNFLCSGKGTLEDLCRFGRGALKHDPRRDAVETAFDAALTLLPEPRPDPEPEPAEEVTADAALEEDGNDPNGPDDDDGLAKALRAALVAVYAEETISDPQERSARLHSIQAFDPTGVRIPSMEEARRMRERVAPGGGGRLRALEGGARTRNAPRARSAGESSTAVVRSRKPGRPALPKPGATHPVAGDTKPAAIAAPGPDCAGKLPAPVIGLRQLNEAVNCVAMGLNKTRELDERVWLLFSDPEHDLEDPRTLAEDLATQDSAAQQAGAALRLAAQQQRVRAILALPPNGRLHSRRFDLEAEAWLNTMASNRNRGFKPDSRHLISLPRMLDNAAGALVRVEALRAAVDILGDVDPRCHRRRRVAAIRIAVERNHVSG